MKITLRTYQEEAISKILWAQKFDGADLCVLPTGAGKSIVIAYLAYQINKPILIIQPNKEILEQNYKKLLSYVPVEKIGIYSAAFNRKEINFFTFATIQSIYKKPEEFAHFKHVIIDECHLVNPKNLNGMFTQFLENIGSPKVVGFTATPYRLDTLFERTSKGILSHTTIKLINRTKNRFWHRIIYNINNEDLILQKYLVPIKYINRSIIEHNQIPTNISKTDFDLVEYEKIINKKQDFILESVFFALEIAKNSVLVFCSSIEQANNLSKFIPNSAVVTSKTPRKERNQIIDNFKNKVTKIVFNVQVLTTGFDHPDLDCILLLRPTRSLSLYYQMLGRGIRIANNKTNCKVIDMTGTVEELGRIETIKLVKREMWEIESEMGSWHNRKLYSFMINKT